MKSVLPLHIKVFRNTKYANQIPNKVQITRTYLRLQKWAIFWVEKHRINQFFSFLRLLYLYCR